MLYKENIMRNIDVKLFDMPLLDQDKHDEEKQLEEQIDEVSLQNKLQCMEREAYEKGFEAGESAGFAMGEEKAKVLIDRLENIIKEVLSLKERILRELEPKIIELAVGIAKKIILKELTTDPENIVEITKAAMMKIERAGQITIKINPSLYDLFMKHNPDLVSIHPDILFDIDPSVSLYGPVVMGPLEDAITDVDEQMKALIIEMRDRLGQ